MPTASAVVDLGEVRAAVRIACDAVTDAIRAGGGDVTVERPGLLRVRLPLGEAVEITVAPDDYLPRVYNEYTRRGWPIPPSLRTAFIEAGILNADAVVED